MGRRRSPEPYAARVGGRRRSSSSGSHRSPRPYVGRAGERRVWSESGWPLARDARGRLLRRSRGTAAAEQGRRRRPCSGGGVLERREFCKKTGEKVFGRR